MLTHIAFSTKNNFFINDETLYKYNMKTRFTRPEDSKPISELMKNNVYLGYIKIPLIDEKAQILFIFINNVVIKLYDIYGINIPFGDTVRSFKMTHEETVKAKNNNFNFYPIIPSTKKDNRNYYLMSKYNKEDYFKLKNIELPEPEKYFKNDADVYGKPYKRPIFPNVVKKYSIIPNVIKKDSITPPNVIKKDNITPPNVIKKDNITPPNIVKQSNSSIVAPSSTNIKPSYSSIVKKPLTDISNIDKKPNSDDDGWKTVINSKTKNIQKSKQYKQKNKF
jgi:hypothetical protein